MNLYRDKPLIDERADTLIGIHLGIQPSTCPSHRCGAEIEQHGPAALLRSPQSRVDVLFPLHSHVAFLLFEIS
jgi:hypothetical protein